MIRKDYIKLCSQLPSFEEAIDALCTEAAAYKQKVFKINFFVDSADKTEYLKQKSYINQAMASHFKDCMPCWCVLSQKPKDATACMSLVYTACDKLFLTVDALPVVFIKSEEPELWVCGLGDSEENDIKKASVTAFEQMLKILNTLDFTMDDVVRQWNYIGEILHIEQTPKGPIQNYQAFNDIRNKYYEAHKKAKRYPAATGIGMKTPGVIIDFFAKKTTGKTLSFPVQSGIQENPFAYTEDVLVGEPLDCSNKKPPLFERARLLVSEDQAQIFVSGTASIKNQETIAIGDVEEQTKNTINFIENLIGFENVVKIYKDFRFKHHIYQRIRVYIKRRDDFEKVQRICQDVYPGSCLVFVESDVCRDNLLVEIEADALYFS